MMDPADRERLDVLAGARPKSGRKRAVRVEDLIALLQLPDRLKSAPAAGSAPTKAEHDALVADLKAVHQRLQEVVAVLREAVLK